MEKQKETNGSTFSKRFILLIVGAILVFAGIAVGYSGHKIQNDLVAGLGLIMIFGGILMVAKLFQKEYAERIEENKSG
jgi:hypothetical protein